MNRISVLYDPDCRFCRFSMAVLLRWDRGGRLRPVPLFSPEADALLDGMPRERQAASWHAADERGDVYSGGTAFAPVLERLPRGRRLAALARRFPRPLDLAYRWVAEHRTFVGRLVPDAASAWANDVLRVSGLAPRGR
jgi:predicted DCC family thiol-disulfide oxidoreductase YuxK